jgi:hypothetical protein
MKAAPAAEIEIDGKPTGRKTPRILRSYFSYRGFTSR